MLGKLLKHEFKATSRILPFSYLACAVFFLVAFIARSILPDVSAAYLVPAVIFLLSGIAVLILTYVLLIMRFHKSMYGNEGYLTQTLPVSKGQLLASKMIPCAIWMIAGTLVFLFVILGFAYLVTGDASVFFDMVKELYGASPLYTSYLLISLVTQSALFVTEVFFALSLANTSKFLRNNIAFSIVFYILTTFVVSLLDVLAMLFVPLGIQSAVDGSSSFVFENMFGTMMNEINSTATVAAPMTIGIGSLILDIILIVVFILLTNYLLKRKINVK